MGEPARAFRVRHALVPQFRRRVRSRNETSPRACAPTPTETGTWASIVVRVGAAAEARARRLLPPSAARGRTPHIAPLMLLFPEGQLRAREEPRERGSHRFASFNFRFAPSGLNLLEPGPLEPDPDCLPRPARSAGRCSADTCARRLRRVHLSATGVRCACGSESRRVA
jgi:hypothetical protein